VSRTTGAPARRASLAIDNLRAIVIVLVLAFHSVLAYLNFLPAHPFAFDEPPYLWRSFPIVDTARFMGFDLFCAWLDVFLMSFFFMLSGLFVWPSLQRKGAWAFLSDRLLRIGVPNAHTRRHGAIAEDHIGPHTSRLLWLLARHHALYLRYALAGPNREMGE